MVAEAEPRVSSSSRNPKGRGNAPAIDLLTRSKARNLYVVRQLPAQEVARECGITANQLYSLACREGWTKTRIQIREKELEASRKREEADISELVEAVAVKSQVLALGTLDGAIEELKNPGEFQAKNLQALSVAAKNFVGLYRQAKNLDAEAKGEGSTINVAFFGGFVSKADEKRVSPSAEGKPCIDVPTTDAPAGAGEVVCLPPSQSGPELANP